MEDIFEDEAKRYGQYNNVLLTVGEYTDLKRRLGNIFDGVLQFYSARKAERRYVVDDDYKGILRWGVAGYEKRQKEKTAKDINVGHFDSASFEDSEWTEDADSVFKCRADLAYRSIIRKVAERHIEVLPGETEPQAFIRYVSEKVRRMLRGEFDKPKIEQPVRYTVDINPNEPFRRENETYRQAAARHRLNGY